MKWTATETMWKKGGIALALCGAVALCFWIVTSILRPGPGNVSVPIQPAKEVMGETKVDLQPSAPIKAYKPRVKAKLDLPDEVQDSPTQHVTATGKLNAEERPYTLTAVLDSDTGESTVYARPDPLPLLGLSRHGAVGIGYGFKDGAQVSWISARQDILRSKALFLQINGVAFTDQSYYIGGAIEYRW